MTVENDRALHHRHRIVVAVVWGPVCIVSDIKYSRPSEGLLGAWGNFGVPGF